ncbi:MAG: hypothetical protein MUP19_00875 [Candidatus Aminicenantes bacterium]|jgi:hypothetical protein|nr:hypothetical protein [Candidatus Aminicenantes bacterium]
MAKSKQIEITPKMLESLDALRQALAGLPPGESKARAEAALAHLSRSFEGPAQLKLSRQCPINTTIIRS